MDRRNFIRKAGTGVLAVTLLGKNTYAFSRQLAAPGSCIPTTADILGPFYRANAPFRSDLRVNGDPGTVLMYQGIITDAACNPLENAIVDVWQANDGGAYDNASPQFHYRGRVQTDSTGAYAFTAVKPGWYLNGSQFRPSHIHFRVTAPGFTELITQLYFEGDPYIAADPWASSSAAQMRIIPIVDVNGTDTVHFNIALASSLGMEDGTFQSPVRFPNPVENPLVISSPSEPLKSLELFDMNGILVRRSYEINATVHQVDIATLPSGIYFCRVETTQGIYVHKVLKQ